MDEAKFLKKRISELEREIGACRSGDSNCSDGNSSVLSNGAGDGEERLRSIVECVIDAIIMINSRGLILSVNTAATRIFQYSREELVGENVSILMPEPFRALHDTFIDNYLETGEEKIIGVGRETLGKRKDGHVFPIDISVAKFEQRGQIFFTGIVRDITQRKQLEEQLRQAEKMESVGRLAGGIAHDFNNQLGMILFDVDLLLEDIDPQDPIRGDLKKIREVMVRSAELTRQLLVFSRRQPLQMSVIDLGSQVSDMYRMLDRLLGADITVDIDLDEDVPLVLADSGSIDQVIVNFALNSRDAMPDGGELRIKLFSVDIDSVYCDSNSQAKPGAYVCLSISDNGTGIDQENITQIFEPFFTTKEVGKGTGLGLSVVYGIIQEHAGWVAVESQINIGTEFCVYIPFHKN